MSKVVFIDDFPDGTGGAEQVNRVVGDHFDVEWLKSDEITKLGANDFYILGNISLMHPGIIDAIVAENLNYVILEHDYKICSSRHPWSYEGCIVPEEERINYDLYKNAKAVFVQTTDHLNVFKANGVKANFINLKSTLWSDEDLDLLEVYWRKTEIEPRDWTCAVVNSSNWIKNTEGAIAFCKEARLDYTLIHPNDKRSVFIFNLSRHPSLVFFPLARESCCRLVVEARCLNMNVITSINYGAVLEPWYEMSGLELIEFLRKSTKKNLKKIKKYLP